MHKKITTIEDLAVMLAGEFRGIEKRFNELEERVHKLELRIDELEGEMRAGIAQLRKDIKEADTRTAVIALEIRVSKLEGMV
jgi:predicted  nucleic acid-binding Zn-ribbon protein